jgi:hypothetical protein
MASYEVRWKPSAVKELRGLPAEPRTRVLVVEVVRVWHRPDVYRGLNG